MTGGGGGSTSGPGSILGNYSPGVPYTRSQLVPSILSTTGIATSATPVLGGPPITEGTGIVGTGVLSSNGQLYWVSSTGANNVWPAVLTEQGVVVSPFKSSTPIVLPNRIQP